MLNRLLAALWAFALVGTPAAAQQVHPLAGKTCQGIWKAKSGSSCDQCYGSFRVVFDHAGGAMHHSVYGFKAYNNPHEVAYQPRPVTDLTVEGNIFRYVTDRKVKWMFDFAGGTGETDPPRSLHQRGADATNIVCN